jgi:hypothetical protein
VNADSALWSTLIDLNRAADSLIDLAKKRIEPSKPVSRELLTNASIEVRFDNLPTSYADDAVVPVNSAALSGNNVKRGVWTNGASRLYLRELAFDQYFVDSATNTRKSQVFPLEQLPPYYRWNFLTSITQKQYADKRVSMFAGGRKQAGNHLAFRDPLVIEPMETLTFEVELLSFGSTADAGVAPNVDAYVVALYLSGYREGM